MKFLRKILFPFAPLYFLVTWIRNKCYDWSLSSSSSYDFPVICIGNLSVGGTGKTPMVEYVIRLLLKHKKIATLSRGYKRKTNGFLLANEKHTTEDLGDEPFQIFSKFKNIRVAVDENRREGIKKLRVLNPKPEVIILDDAFQHRKVRAGLNILLTAYDDLFYKDIMLPTGNLREPTSGKNRANLIVVTKCPQNIKQTEKIQIVKNINPNKSQTVFFSHIKYADKIYSLDESQDLASFNDFTLVTGIAQPKPLVSYLKSLGLNFEHLEYRDHHNFNHKELDVLSKKQNILTTEKDFVRLRRDKRLKDKLFYLPIEVEIDQHEELDRLIKNFVNA